MDERQLGYPACEQSTILYPCPGTSALELSVNASLACEQALHEVQEMGRVQRAPESLLAGLRVLTT